MLKWIHKILLSHYQNIIKTAELFTMFAAVATAGAVDPLNIEKESSGLLLIYSKNLRMTPLNSPNQVKRIYFKLPDLHIYHVFPSIKSYFMQFSRFFL